MKRIISIIAAICIFAAGSVFNVSVSQAASISVAAPQEEKSYAELLKILNIIDADSDIGDMSADVSRGEFAALLAKAAQLPKAGYEKLYWDVSAENEYAAEITAMTNAGYIRGYNDGSFKPKEKITKNEALVMAVCTLGYKSAAADVNIYVKKAEELDLDYGLTSDMTLRDAYVLINNMLCAYTASSSIEDGKIKLQTGTQTMLECVYGLYCEVDVLKAVGCRTAVSGAQVESGYVVIGNRRMKNSSEAYNDYLGYRVKYFYTDNDELVYCYKIKKQDNLVIDAESIEDFTNLTLKYRTSNNAQKKVKLTTSVDYIYNGRYVDYGTQFDDTLMEPKNGYIDLIDNDDDGVYDFVNIRSSYDLVVQSAYAVDETHFNISASNNIEGETAFNLSLIDDNEHIYSLTDANGNAMSKETLYNGDILTVFASIDGKVIEVIYADKKIEGTIQSSANHEKGYQILTIDGKQYKTAYGFNDEISCNKTAIIYFDAYDKVAAVKYIDESEYQTALALDYSRDLNEGTVYVRILTPEEKVVVMSCAEKVCIDGVWNKTDSAAYDALTGNDYKLPYPIRYRSNSEGLVIDIDTPNQGTSEIGDNLVCRYNLSSSLKYKASTGVLNGHYIVDSNTVIYSIPSPTAEDIENGREDEVMRQWSNYGVEPRSLLENDKSYNVAVYSIGDEGFNADMLVVNSVGFNLSYGEMAIVSKKYQSVDEDDEIVTAMELSRGGSTIYGYAEVGSEVEQIINSLNVGDIVRYSAKSDGEYQGIQEIYRYSDGAYLYNGGVTPNFVTMMTSETRRYIKAKVHEVSGDYVGLVDAAHEGDVTDTDIEAYRFNNWYIYEVNGNNLVIRKATLDDVVEGKYNGEDASTVVLSSQYSQPSLAFIIK